MRKHRINLFMIGAVTVLLINLTSSTGWSQGSTTSSQLPEEVQAATNPAGQVPDEIPGDEGSTANGRSLFAQHCSACHAIGKQIIGPALASVHNRRPLDWLVAFIQNSQDVISADSTGYAQQLFEQYNRQVMPDFEFLSRDEILDIMAYIKVESVSTTAGVSSAMTDETESVQTQPSGGEDVFSQKDEVENPGVDLGLIMGGIVVGIVLVVVVLVALRKRSRAKQEV